MYTTFSLTFFLLFTSLTTSTIIHDSTGNNLLRGIPYNILPLLRGSGGGVTVSRLSKTTCPLNVTQEPFEVSHGVPFTFNPIILDEQFIRQAYPISIEAAIANPCTGPNSNSNIWQLTLAPEKDNVRHYNNENSTTKKRKDHDDDDEDGGVDLHVETVTTGGKVNKPESCFQIVEDNLMPGLESYQIQNCPFKCGSGSREFSCYNVGVVVDGDGNRYLGRTDAVFPVVFTNSYDGFSRQGETSGFARASDVSRSVSRSVE